MLRCEHRHVRNKEDGQSTAEYAAIIIVAVTLVTALIVLATPLGKQIVCHVESTLSQIFGGGPVSCSDTTDDSHKPTKPCVTSERTRQKTVSGTVFITVEGGGRIKVETMSDGTYRVTETGILKGSYKFTSPGVSGKVTYDDQSWGKSFGGSGGDEESGEGGDSGGGAGPSGSAEVGVSGEGSRTFTVKSESEKDELVDYLQNQVDTAAASAATPIAGAIKYGVDWATDHDGTRSYTPPEPTDYTVQFGREGSANATMSAGPAEGSVGGKVADALGATYHSDGTTTVYYSANLSADAQGNISIAGGAVEPTGKAKASADTMIAVTVDKDGKPKSMSMKAAIDAQASASLESVFTTDDPTKKAEYGRVYEATVDMTNPESAQAGYDLALATGIPLYGAAKSLDGTTPAQDFVNAAMRDGTLTRREMSKSSTKNGGFDLSAKGDGFNFGAGYQDTSTSTEYSNGEYWNGRKWSDWEGC